MNERVCVFFFFQAEDGIRDSPVTGVQTCALPIYVAGKVRLMPDEFLNVELASIGNTTEEFKNYLEPLTGAPLDIPKYLIEN